MKVLTFFAALLAVSETATALNDSSWDGVTLNAADGNPFIK